METTTYAEWLTEYHELYKLNATYRMGQSFITNFIKDDTDLSCRDRLWESTSWIECVDMINKLIISYQWNYSALQKVR